MEAPAAVGPVVMDGRPTKSLPLRQLFQLSIYWFGLTSIFAALDTIILPKRIGELVDPGQVATTVALITGAGAILAVIVQPTIGSISDYTITRWGRRKPYIVIGSVLDVVFLVGLATSNAVLAIFAFYLLLQFSSNFAQGPFQGYVPDLVPQQQVGLASGLMGLMSTLGPVGGIAIASLGLLSDPPDYRLPTIALGVIELATAVVTVVTVDEGRAARDRGGRSWVRVAAETWSREVLAERSFVWLVASRLFVLAGISMLLKIVAYYMDRSLLLDNQQQAFWINVTAVVVVVAIAFSTIPSARLSDRLGRKPLVYAATGIGAVGMAVVAAAPNPPVAMLGALIVGLGAGAFLAVDWALMTDIIPKAAAGRFMGFSNVATGLAGVVAVVAGGLVVDGLYRVGQGPAGPRAAYALALVFFALGALFLYPVDPRRHEDRVLPATAGAGEP